MQQHGHLQCHSPVRVTNKTHVTWTELVLISSERPSSIWLLFRELYRVMNYPGSSNFFGTRVPGTRFTSLIMIIYMYVKVAYDNFDNKRRYDDDDDDDDVHYI